MARRLIFKEGPNLSSTGTPADGFRAIGFEGTEFNQRFGSTVSNIASGGTGTSGTPGTSGTSGQNGATGSNGLSGSSGTSGVDGSTGSNGLSGSSGTSGVDGVNGSNGLSGTSGSSGVKGATGSNGLNGSSGTSGINGSSGSSGSSGINGSSGSSGTSGSSGNSGGYLKMTQLVDNVAATTRSGSTIVTEWTSTYTSVAGSTLLFNLSFSAYTPSGGLKQFDLVIDNVTVASTTFYFNSTNIHHTIPCSFGVETLSAGSHTIQIRIPSGVTVDSQDYAHLTVIETMTNGVSGTSGTSGTSITVPGSNNQVLTSDGAGSLVAEANLTFDGSILRSTYLYSTNSTGDEGGEINLSLPQTNTGLTGGVVIDSYQNKIRIFEGGGNSRGVSIDLSKAPNSVGGELLWKASGFVNAGTDVTCGNLKARISTSGNRSLQLSTVSGTYTVYGSSVYVTNATSGSTISDSSPRTITTTPTYLNSGYHFGIGGYTDTWLIMDTSAQIAWRINMIIGTLYINNFISIERLY